MMNDEAGGFINNSGSLHVEIMHNGLSAIPKDVPADQEDGMSNEF
jgi:hypothetical protein